MENNVVAVYVFYKYDDLLFVNDIFSLEKTYL